MWRQALVPAASTPVSRPGAGEDSGRRRDESRRGTQECVRHENRRGPGGFSGLVQRTQMAGSQWSVSRKGSLLRAFGSSHRSI